MMDPDGYMALAMIVLLAIATGYAFGSLAISQGRDRKQALERSDDPPCSAPSSQESPNQKQKPTP